MKYYIFFLLCSGSFIAKGQPIESSLTQNVCNCYEEKANPEISFDETSIIIEKCIEGNLDKEKISLKAKRGLDIEDYEDHEYLKFETLLSTADLCESINQAFRKGMAESVRSETQRNNVNYNRYLNYYIEQGCNLAATTEFNKFSEMNFNLIESIKNEENEEILSIKNEYDISLQNFMGEFIMIFALECHQYRKLLLLSMNTKQRLKNHIKEDRVDLINSISLELNECLRSQKPEEYESCIEQSLANNIEIDSIIQDFGDSIMVIDETSKAIIRKSLATSDELFNYFISEDYKKESLSFTKEELELLSKISDLTCSCLLENKNSDSVLNLCLAKNMLSTLIIDNNLARDSDEIVGYIFDYLRRTCSVFLDILVD